MLRPFDTSAEGLEELVRAGESATVEFKKALPPDSVLARVLSAFANTEGGILLIGIDERQGIVGVPGRELTGILERLEGVAAEVLFSPAYINATKVPSGWVPFVVVNKAPDHLAPVRTADGKVYGRARTQIQELPLAEPAAREEETAPCTVFVAMSFREEEEPALVDYYAAMKRAAKQTGLPLELMRVDQVEGDYDISQKVLTQISAADIVIADFTLSPHNVYYEAGFARGEGKRLILTAHKGTVLEFDVRNWRTIFYKNATELEAALIPALRTAFEEVVSSSSGPGS